MPPTLRVATADCLWVHSESGARCELEGREVRWIESAASGRWAIVGSRQIWHQPPEGDWSRVATSDDLDLRCLLPYAEGVLAGTAGAHLLQLEGSTLGLVAGFDYAHGRDEWFTPWGGPPDVRSMTLADDERVYVNVHVGGILRSEVAGTVWVDTIDIGKDVHEVMALPSRASTLLAATSVGLATSDDKGGTWTCDAGGLAATYARAVALAGDTVLMSASDGPRGGRSGLYRRPLDGAGFERCSTGLPEWFDDNIDTGCLAGAGDFAAFGTQDGRVFVSKDSGASWELARDGLGRVNRLVLD